MANPVTCPTNPITRDIDVVVNLRRPQTELATDMTMLVFLTPGLDFAPDNGRVRYYSTMTALEQDVALASEAWFAGSAFFAKQNRPETMALGRVFENPTPASLMFGDYNLAALQQVTDGAFKITVNGEETEVAELDFTSAQTIDDVMTVIQTASPGTIDAGVLYTGYGISTGITGDSATLTYASAPDTGTDVSGLLGLTQGTGANLIQGYAPGGLVAEAQLVAAAARCNGRPIYGWTIDRKYRETEDQKAFADWAESQQKADFSACTNSLQAYNPADITNISFYAKNKGYKRTSVMYHHNEQVYPDVSYLAEALSTDYSQPDSAITLKFKQLDGIEPSPLSETQLAILESRNCNCYVAVGNTARTVRPGAQSADTWWTDSLVNLDNYVEELQVEVYNVFLRNRKVPYTTIGQNMLVSAAAKINAKYTRNGVFADREIEAPETETGYVIAPATDIIPVPVAFATTSQRVARLAPPIKIVAYEAGAMHKVTLNVDAIN